MLDFIVAVLTCPWCVAQFHHAVLGSCKWINKAALTTGPAKSERALAKVKIHFAPQGPDAEPHKSPALYTVSLQLHWLPEREKEAEMSWRR